MSSSSGETTRRRTPSASRQRRGTSCASTTRRSDRRIHNLCVGRRAEPRHDRGGRPGDRAQPRRRPRACCGSPHTRTRARPHVALTRDYGEGRLASRVEAERQEEAGLARLALEAQEAADADDLASVSVIARRAEEVGPGRAASGLPCGCAVSRRWRPLASQGTETAPGPHHHLMLGSPSHRFANGAPARREAGIDRRR